MLSVVGRGAQLCDGLTRREVLRVGALSAGGLSLPQLLAAQAKAVEAAPVVDRAFGRAKNIIFLYLAGGPPQHETFDPKPDAPAEIRGAFAPIQTNIPGIQFCELLPRTAALTDKLAVVRSMATDDNTHSSSSAWVLTGYKYRGPNARVILPTDWPWFGSLVKMLKPSGEMPGLSTVWIPHLMRLNENVTPAGQTGGFLGAQWNPEVFVGDPSRPEYQIESLQATGIAPLRLGGRRTLLNQLEAQLVEHERNAGAELYDTYQQQAFDLLTTGRARAAFDISREPDPVRQRYGHNRWGQCVLLARRLVEAGVRLVHVQWPREPGDNAVDNPLWDTHAQNADRLEDVLCPMLDVGYSALIEDLEQRGLLDETLVVAVGEFGRTPKINDKGGRDHWGSVFSVALAGAGISGGQVYGASDRNGAFPIADRVRPGDLTATIFHLLGINPQGSFPDRQGREHRLTDGEPLHVLMGTEPATDGRAVMTGDISRVPPFDPQRLLARTDFTGGNAIRDAAAPSRPKGWRASPILTTRHDAGLGVRHCGPDETASTAVPHAAIGFRGGLADETLSVPQGAKALLAQEVRSPFAGTYRFRVRIRCEASSQEFFESVFRENFTCRLMFVQFNTVEKRANDTRALASVELTPEFAAADSTEWQSVELTRTFANPNPGGNFSFGAGMGVAIEIEKTTAGALKLQATDAALIRIADVELEFRGKEVNDNVTV